MRIGIVGATGAVGEEMLRQLGSRKFPLSDLKLFASPRSVGKALQALGKSHSCSLLNESCFQNLDLVFFDASDAVSEQWVPKALEAGAKVVDHSGQFRMNTDVPLVVPEINAETIKSTSRLISGPNCSTIQLVLALNPLKKFGLKRVVVTTFQSVSGAGRAAIDELQESTRMKLQGREMRPEAFLHPIAFNCIPQIGAFKEDGYTSEELKIIKETRKILSLPELRITATAVRVPTIRTHCETVNVETDRPISVQEAKNAFAGQLGLCIEDIPEKGVYPMPVTSAHSDSVFVGRIRKDESVQYGISFWIVGDNLRKGAATNAIQIAEALIKLRT